MGKIINAAMVASALLCSHTAGATPPSGTFTGIVRISTGLTFSCHVTVDIFYSSGLGVDLANITLTPGSFFCADGITGGPSGPRGPFLMGYSGTTVTFNNVALNGYAFGSCGGDLVGTWDGITLVFEAQLLPGSPGCLFEMLATN